MRSSGTGNEEPHDRQSEPDATQEPATVSPSPGEGSPAVGGSTVAPPGYEVLSKLGRGGMAVVYQACHTALQRRVALKMVLAGAHAGPSEQRRFRTEAEAIARLQHPHIVQIYDIGERDGLPYLALEYVDGGSLAGKLNGVPRPPQDAARLVETLARAVHYAHQRGVVHRDLKPGNILLTADGTPKVADFGLARLLDQAGGPTASGAVLGTPNYMAPEQARGRGKEAGPAADIYALGAILYELLTGRPPFRASTPLDTILQVISAEPVPPSQVRSTVPCDLETVCLKCLQKEPAQRYGTPQELADDLQRFCAGEPVRARPLRTWEKLVRAGRRRLRVAKLLAAGPDAGPAEGPDPTPVAVGAGTVFADAFPLPVPPGFLSRERLPGATVLVRRSAGRLVLRPSWMVRWPALLCFLGAALAGIAAVALTIAAVRSPRVASSFSPPHPATPLILFGVNAIFWGAMGLVILRRGRHFVFDRDAGQVVERRFWSRRRWPLRDAIAVQLLTSSPRVPFLLSLRLLQSVMRVYQLNLVFTDADPSQVYPAGARDQGWARRMNIACPMDGYWARQAGRDLAAFLGVPLIDLTASAQPNPRPAGLVDGAEKTG